MKDSRSNASHLSSQLALCLGDAVSEGCTAYGNRLAVFPPTLEIMVNIGLSAAFGTLVSPRVLFGGHVEDERHIAAAEYLMNVCKAAAGG